MFHGVVSERVCVTEGVCFTVMRESVCVCITVMSERVCVCGVQTFNCVWLCAWCHSV